MPTFPIFQTYPDLLYFDNAATTHKPHEVIQAEVEFYTEYNSNINRSVYPLAIKAEKHIHESRIKVQNFLGANTIEEIIFTRGCTDSLNMLSTILNKARESEFRWQTKSKTNTWKGLKKGDNVVVSVLEHHSNYLPWRVLCQELGLELRVAGMTKDYDMDFDSLSQLVDSKTRIVSLTHSSNVLGGILDVSKAVDIVRQQSDAVFVMDTAQSASHTPIEVSQNDLDFVAVSGHKLYGPTGIGVLYGRSELLSQLDPADYGGEMVDLVTNDEIVYRPLPHKFEAGTLSNAQIAGLGTACQMLHENRVGMEYSHSKEEKRLAKLLIEGLKKIGGFEIFSATDSVVVSLVPVGSSILDMGTYLGQKNVCVRTGKHCNHILVDTLTDYGTLRFSLAMYNTEDQLNKALEIIKEYKDKYM